MKYALIIDIPLEDDDVRVEYLAYNHCGDLIKKGMDCKMKPLPEKKPIDKTLYFDGYDNLPQSALARGYNAYHDEIIGGE